MPESEDTNATAPSGGEEPRKASFYLGLFATAGAAGAAAAGGGTVESAERSGGGETLERTAARRPTPAFDASETLDSLDAARSSQPTGAGAPDLSEARIRQSVAAAGEMLRGLEPEGETAERCEAALRGAERALAKLAQEGEMADLSDDEKIGLEAVVIADGTRPVLFVQDGQVDPASPELGTWKKSVELLDQQIRQVAQSVGRINLPGSTHGFAGTGWVIAPGIFVTNRHVLEGIATPPRDGSAAADWTFKPGVSIDFAAEFERPAVRSFPIRELVFAGPDEIAGEVVLTHLDMAVLRCEVGDGDDFPPALTLESDAGLLNHGRSVYVTGFPARPRFETGDVINDLFRDTFGFKRWAPGLIDKAPGESAADTRSWVATHDASTLGGNSGSCVVDFGSDGTRVVGLHFGGRFRSHNFAHAVARLQAELGPLGARYQ